MLIKMLPFELVRSSSFNCYNHHPSRSNFFSFHVFIASNVTPIAVDFYRNRSDAFFFPFSLFSLRFFYFILLLLLPRLIQIQLLQFLSMLF